jgi:hypothetical protein
VYKIISKTENLLCFEFALFSYEKEELFLRLQKDIGKEYCFSLEGVEVDSVEEIRSCNFLNLKSKALLSDIHKTKEMIKNAGNEIEFRDRLNFPHWKTLRINLNKEEKYLKFEKLVTFIHESILLNKLLLFASKFQRILKIKGDL